MYEGFVPGTHQRNWSLPFWLINSVRVLKKYSIIKFQLNSPLLPLCLTFALKTHLLKLAGIYQKSKHGHSQCSGSLKVYFFHLSLCTTYESSWGLPWFIVDWKFFRLCGCFQFQIPPINHTIQTMFFPFLLIILFLIPICHIHRSGWSSQDSGSW